MSNLQTVQGTYAAFGRVDILGILSYLADRADWEYAYAKTPNEVPWLQPRRDKAGVAKFFESLGALEITRFIPKGFLEGSDVVVALFDIEATVKRTGNRIVETDEAHIWRFNRDGKVVAFRHCADTHQQLMALKG